MKYRSLLENSGAYTAFKDDLRQNRLNHCYMFLSEDGAAIENLLFLCAAAAICPDGGCGNCLVCRKVFDGNSERVYVLPDKASVADVGMMQDDMAPAFDGRKVYIIRDVSALSASVQNKLLKTLEEPKEGTLLLLGAVNENTALETVKSRAEKLFLERFSKSVVADELKNLSDDEEAVALAAECSGGLLFKAERIVGDKHYAECYRAVMNTFSKLDNSKKLAVLAGSLSKDSESASVFLEITEKTVENMLLYKQGVRDASAELAAIADKYSAAAIAEFAELTFDARARLNANCSTAAVLENLLLKILEVAYKCR